MLSVPKNIQVPCKRKLSTPCMIKASNEIAQTGQVSKNWINCINCQKLVGWKGE